MTGQGDNMDLDELREKSAGDIYFLRTIAHNNIADDFDALLSEATRLTERVKELEGACKAAIHLYEQGCVDRGFKDEPNWIDETHDQLIAAIEESR